MTTQHPPVLSPAPERVVENGQFNLGVFGSAFRELNFADARPEPGAQRWGLFRQRRLVEFQHFAIGNGRFHVSVALFDTKGIGQAQVSIYDRETKAKYRHERKTAPWELKLAGTALDGEASFARGAFKIQFQNGLARGAHRLAFSCPASSTLPAVEGEFLCEETAASAPVVVCLPFGGGAAMYSHKGILPAEGRLRIGSESHDFPRATSYTVTDFHKGFYPNPLQWNWAAGAGFDTQGRRYGFNLTRNQVVEPDRYNENWVWLQDPSDPAGLRGHAERLPVVSFHFKDSTKLGDHWHIHDDEGRVDIEFHPVVAHSIDLNVLLMHSRYRGPYGHFTGHLLTSNGNAIDVAHCFGMAEDFYLRG